jgi:UDP-3-O-[3-hydroxymyristoyl] glucosamine N-acyltransferase
VQFSLAEILEATGGWLANSDDLTVAQGQIRVERPSTLPKSGASDLAFFFSREYESELPLARPGILITGEVFVKPLKAAGLPFWKTTAIVACKDPYHAMAVLSGKFADGISQMAHAAPVRGTKADIHPSAVVDPTAEIGEAVSIGPNSVIGAKARIGAGTRIYPSCFVGPGARLGSDCVLFPNVVVYERAEIGDRVRIHAGSVIGADGFGYAPKLESGKPTKHEKIYHMGRAVIEDDVEIGANSCVDRGTFGDTRVGKGAKIDNLCQVGHNAEISEGAILCGGTALAGGARIGRFALILGHVGVINNIRVGEFAKVAAHTLVSKDVPPGGVVAGIPQRDLKEHFKVHAFLNRMIKKGRGQES